MKHAVSTTSSDTTRQNQWWFACLLLLALVALQGRALSIEPLAEQLISVNEVNIAEQLLPSGSADGDDQSAGLFPSFFLDTPLQSAGYPRFHFEQSHPSDLRWITPATRAPPAFS